MTEHNTGPKTPEGKARSSMNALKHGLYATKPAAIREIEERAGIDYNDIYIDMHHYYEPQDPVELQLVKRIARCVWRLALSESMEQRVLERSPNTTKPGASYEKILKYERLVDIHLHRAIEALNRKRQGSTTKPTDETLNYPLRRF